MVEILLTLLGCAALLGLIALYFRFTDSGVIEEEEEETVEQETPEEHARARLAEEERASQYVDEGPYDSGL